MKDPVTESVYYGVLPASRVASVTPSGQFHSFRYNSDQYSMKDLGDQDDVLNALGRKEPTIQLSRLMSTSVFVPRPKDLTRRNASSL